MTQRIVDVLEGTKPAFDLRDAKYEVLDRRLVDGSNRQKLADGGSDERPDAPDDELV